MWRSGLVALCALALGVQVCSPLEAHAQDDWALTREAGERGHPGHGPRSARRAPGPRQPMRSAPPSDADRSEALTERYLRVLQAEPSDGFALERLIAIHREQGGSIDGLVGRIGARIEQERVPYAPRMIRGHLLRRVGRFDEALRDYEAAAAIRPDAALPRVAIARVHEERGDADAARAALEDALARASSGPLRDEVLRRLAMLALDRGDVDEARRRFDALAGGAGGSLHLRTELARALLDRGRHDLAIAEYERVAAALRGDRRALAPVLVELARAQLGAGRTDDAIATLTRAEAASASGSGLRAEIGELMLQAHRRADRLQDLVARLARRRGGGFEEAALLGRVHDELGHDDEALAAYRRALALRRDDVDLRARIIQVLGRAGRMDELVQEYRALIRRAPDEPRHRIDLAELLRQLDRQDEARALLADASRRSRAPEMHRRLAELYARWGDHEQARAELELLARLEPGEPLHWIALGSQRFEQGDRAGALAAWRRILTLGPDRAAAHVSLGGILADHDLLADAITELEEAVRLAPDSLSAVRALASTLERAGRDEDAEVHWYRVLELVGDDRAARREAREHIVGIWLRTRMLDRRVAEFARAFSADPPDVAAGHLLAEAHRRRGDLAAAEAVLSRLAEAEARDVDTWLALERVRTQAGDLPGAITALRRLVDVDPRRAASYLARMAEHALALYRDEDALAFAREAVERNPDDAAAHRRLGDLARARQDLEGAIASYRRALALDDRLFDTAFALAELHLARGEHAEADRIYRAVLARAPDDDLVSRAARASLQIHVGAGTLEDLERDLLPLALAHPDRPVYRRVLVELYDALAAPLLVRARRSGSEAEAARAALRRFGSRALKPLLEALADPHDRTQRRTALALLGPLGNPAAAGPLLAIAEGDREPDVEVRALAVVGAGTVATPEFVPRFAALAAAAPPRVRAAAVLALGWLGGPAAIEALRARLQDDDAFVRAWAAIGLGRLDDRASASRLRSMLGESRSEVRAAAALALGWLRDRDAIPALAALAREQAGVAAAAALFALGGHDAPEARAALVAALFDRDPDARRAAATALRRGMLERGSVPMPLPHESPSAWLARAASGGPLPPPDLEPLLPLIRDTVRQALASGPPARTLAALGVLGAEPGPVGLGELTQDLEGWPDPVRARATAALADLLALLRGDLAAALGSPDASIRTEVIRVLARDPDRRAVELVAGALGDASAAVRRAALDALGPAAAASAEAVERVSSVLARDEDWSMRMRAARALGRMHASVAVPALARALSEDGFAFVREAAAHALREIGGEDAAAVLRRAAALDPEPRVREVAAGTVEPEPTLR